MFRRKFKVQELDHLYVEGLIRQSINELRDMKDVHGNWKYDYHNLTRVRDHLKRHHSVDINITISSNNTANTNIKTSNNSIDNIYLRVANNYKKLARNNYTFVPLENKGTLLLKSVVDLFRK